jgi:hypothetical protein
MVPPDGINAPPPTCPLRHHRSSAKSAASLDIAGSPPTFSAPTRQRCRGWAGDVKKRRTDFRLMSEVLGSGRRGRSSSARGAVRWCGWRARRTCRPSPHPATSLCWSGLMTTRPCNAQADGASASGNVSLPSSRRHAVPGHATSEATWHPIPWSPETQGGSLLSALEGRLGRRGNARRHPHRAARAPDRRRLRRRRRPGGAPRPRPGSCPSLRSATPTDRGPCSSRKPEPIRVARSGRRSLAECGEWRIGGAIVAERLP